MKTFEQENNEILESVISNLFIKTFQKPWDELDKVEQKMTLELYITPECNQNCSYCYLQKYKEELYPSAINDKEVILKNLKIILQYCVDNNIHPNNTDIFTGEIWDTEFGMEILEVILEYIKKGFRTRKIMIPSNFSFILNDDYASRIENYRIEYEKYDGIALKFSCSNDGYYIDKETRPFYNTDKNDLKDTEEFYDKMFKFCQRNNYAFHPMVSAHGIEYWKENFKWWMETLQKYGFDPLHCIMFLETRNNDWTEEKIIHYLDYVNYAFDYYYHELFHDNDQDFLNFIFSRRTKKAQKLFHYSPVRIGHYNQQQACSVSRALCIRVGDLAIAPCHRTSYDEMLLGKIKVENDKIVGLEAKNIQMMNLIWFSDHYSMVKCGDCPINKYCMRGCFGAQFENTKDVLYSCDTVCDLFWAKWTFLYWKYKTCLDVEDPGVQKFIKDMEECKEREEFKKWTTIIQKEF